MSEKYHVWIVNPPGDVHWRGLFEVAQGIACSLTMLGHEVVFDQSPPQSWRGRPIVFNSHCLPAYPDIMKSLSTDAILYNAEQVQSHSAFAPYLSFLERFQVWDYSETNIERMKRLGVERVAHCPVGYYPQLECIKPAATEDVDVLFFGSINDRRRQVLRETQRRGLNIKVLFGAYSDERDHWIARSKLILNVHFYERPIFEIFRCSYLLANRKCVVTEDGGVDPTLETFAMCSTVYASYDQLAQACVEYAAHPSWRSRRAGLGHQMFSSLEQVGFVRDALEKST